MKNVVKLNKCVELEGNLFPIEFKNLPFEPKRIFYVTDVPKDQLRGCHAHYKTRQLLICVQGLLIVELFDGIDWERLILSPGESVLVEPMIWDREIYTTGKDIMLSICSTNYTKEDYITDFELFKELTK